MIVSSISFWVIILQWQTSIRTKNLCTAKKRCSGNKLFSEKRQHKKAFPARKIFFYSRKMLPFYLAAMLNRPQVPPIERVKGPNIKGLRFMSTPHMGEEEVECQILYSGIVPDINELE